jgi:hypothetical protein
VLHWSGAPLRETRPQSISSRICQTTALSNCSAQKGALRSAPWVFCARSNSPSDQ